MVHISPDLMERQYALEAEMLEVAKRRFWKQIAAAREGQREEETPYGTILMRGGIDKVAEGITAYMAGFSDKGAGRRPVAYRMLQLTLQKLPVDVVAFLTLRRVVGSISGRMTLNNSAVTLGTMIEDEIHMADFKQIAPDLAKVTERKITKATSARHKRRVGVIMANRAGAQAEGWAKADRLLLGCQLLEIAEQATGLCSIEQRVDGGADTPYYVTATDKTRAWIEQCTKFNEMFEPHLFPTIVPPKPWAAPEGGGYYRNPGRQPLRLVKTENKNYLEELRNTDLTQVYEAINLVQNTPWRVNTQVLGVVEEMLRQKRAPNGVLPTTEEEPLPAKPGDIDTNDEARRAWKKRAAMVYERNAKNVSKATQAAMVLALADRFRDEPRIYFPHQMDFRGRLYPTSILSPQGSDMTKALLTFADGKPIGDAVAAGWLMIHGANSWGADKLPLVDRIAWVEENEAMILRCAEAPLENQEWTEADAPWAFLAFCFEYAGFKREGYGYVSSLPVSVDGSCNGLQHFSAMLRDEIGGQAVNLVPSDKPNDIYRKVAEEVTAQLRLMTCNGGSDADMARRCLALGIDRSITKRPVMIVPYSGTQYAMREYIEHALREKLDGLGIPEASLETDDRNPLRFVDELGNQTNGVFASSLFLSKLVWDAIGRVVVAARQAMTWLKKSAQLAAGEGLPVSWTTPDGFPVWQAYRVRKMRRILTSIYGGLQLALREDTPEIDRKKQASGVAPNFVHSLDAAALRQYVLIGHLNGITHFSLVHDSFGTVAADADMMGRCLREAFIDLYEQHDVLAQLRKDVEAMLSPERREELPPVPTKGTLDLARIRESDFFFA